MRTLARVSLTLLTVLMATGIAIQYHSGGLESWLQLHGLHLLLSSCIGGLAAAAVRHGRSHQPLTASVRTAGIVAIFATMLATASDVGSVLLTYSRGGVLTQKSSGTTVDPWLYAGSTTMMALEQSILFALFFGLLAEAVRGTGTPATVAEPLPSQTSNAA